MCVAEQVLNNASADIDVEEIKRRYDSESRFRSPSDWTFRIWFYKLNYLQNIFEVFGLNRHETSIEVAKHFFKNINKAVLATGLNFADALSGLYCLRSSVHRLYDYDCLCIGYLSAVQDGKSRSYHDQGLAPADHVSGVLFRTYTHME